MSILTESAQWDDTSKPDQARLSPEAGLSRGQLLLALGYYCYFNRGRNLLVPHLSVNSVQSLSRVQLFATP